MARSKYLDKIETLLKTADNASCDLCLLVYAYIKSAPEKEHSDLFQFFAENICEIESDHSQKVPDMITVEEIKEYSRQGISMLSDFVDQLYVDGISKNRFYKELWHFIMDDSNFSGDRAKSVALFNCLKTKKVPYLDISKALTMEQDEFETEFEDVLHSEYMKRIARINAFGFEQRTERYSMILDALESCQDLKQRTLLFMHFIEIEKRQRDPFMDFLRRLKREKDQDLMDFDEDVVFIDED